MIKSLWLKLLVVVLCCGAQGGLTFLTVSFPVWSTVFGGLIIAITGTMFILTGFPAKEA
jgi:hypothetical protein